MLFSSPTIKFNDGEIPWAMQIITRKTWIISGILLLFAACVSSGEQGVVGEKTSIQAEIPEDGNDLEFSWNFTSIPEESQLSQSDLSISDDGTTAAFTPDVEGNYTVEVSVLQYNDEISTQSFDFIIKAAETTVEIDTPETEESDTIDELVATEVNQEKTTTKWYEEQEAQKALKVLPSLPMAAIVPPEQPDTTAVLIQEPTKPVPVKVKPKVKKPIPGSSIPYDQSRYTIQVASKRNLELAKTVAANLIKAGYDAYIQKAYFKETNEVWYRVRVGSYEKKETALAVAKSLSHLNRETAWVDFVRYED